jgi:hypothetical protein
MAGCCLSRAASCFCIHTGGTCRGNTFRGTFKTSLRLTTTTIRTTIVRASTPKMKKEAGRIQRSLRRILVFLNADVKVRDNEGTFISEYSEPTGLLFANQSSRLDELCGDAYRRSSAGENKCKPWRRAYITSS